MQKDNYFYYLVFGLTIQSTIELPELHSATSITEIDIVVNICQKQLLPNESKSSVTKGNTRFADNYFFLNLPEIASYEVDASVSPSTITFHPNANANMFTVFSWFYGSVLTAALQLHNRFAIHASGVVLNHRLYLFAGDSGLGKSTIASQLKQKNYAFFTDDKCVLNWNKQAKQFTALPALRIMRLWEESAKLVDKSSFLEHEQAITDRHSKFQYIVQNGHTVTQETPISTLFILKNVKSDRELECKPLEGMMKIRALRKQTHRFPYIRFLKKEKIHWDFISKLANHIDIRLLFRPKGTSISKFSDFVDRTIKEKVK